MWFIQSFYWVGFDGITYVLTIFIADTSSLKNRAWMEAWTTTPYIVTTFIGSRAAASFLETSGWRWGYGSFCIITPVIAAPIVFIILRNQRFAMKSGMIHKAESGRTIFQSIEHYFWEFDGKYYASDYFTSTSDKTCSIRAVAYHSRYLTYSPSLLARQLPDERMGFWHDNRYASYWIPVSLCVSCLGKVCLKEMFYSFPPTEGSNNPGCLLPRYAYRHQLLVSRQYSSEKSIGYKCILTASPACGTLTFTISLKLYTTFPSLIPVT